MTQKAFIRIAWIGLINVYLVILAGSVVRVTGAGMGCPDWPKCFDSYIPPTDVSQLPEDYKEQHMEKRLEKVDKFAGYLEVLGFGAVAEELRNDPALLVEEDFNTRKAWTEYINRVIGAFSGLFILWLLFLSFQYRKTKRSVMILALVQVIVLGFQGWMGSIVVASNLTPWVITAHMIPAIFIVGNQLTMMKRVREVEMTKVSAAFYWVLIITLVVTLAQIILGTQLRQEIDAISYEMGFEAREGWLAHVGANFPIHRSFSWTVFLGTGFLAWQKYKHNLQLPLINWLVVTVVLAVLTGMVMAYLGMPAITQSTHMLLSMAMFGLQWWLVMTVTRK